MHDSVLGASIVIQDGIDHAWLWGSTWLCKIRLDPTAAPSSHKRRRHSIKKKQSSTQLASEDAAADERQEQFKESHNFKVVTHYRPILFADFIGPKELVIVERPLVDVLSKLPPAYFKPKYGKT